MKSYEITIEQRDKIISIMRSFGAVVGYLFGSYARGKAGPLSDIDIGVVFSKDIKLMMQEDRVENIRNGLEHMFGRDKVDVVNVSTLKNPLLRYIITLGEGAVLFSDDRLILNTLAQFSRREYEDTRMLRSIQHRALHGLFVTRPIS